MRSAPAFDHAARTTARVFGKPQATQAQTTGRRNAQTVECQTRAAILTETQAGLIRLDNWQRWARGGEIAIIMAHYYPPTAAMAGQHVSSEVWDDDLEASMPVDVRDAETVERLILLLPCRMCLAVRHKYTGRPKHIGMSRHLVDDLVKQAAREIMAMKPIKTC